MCSNSSYNSVDDVTRHEWRAWGPEATLKLTINRVQTYIYTSRMPLCFILYLKYAPMTRIVLLIYCIMIAHVGMSERIYRLFNGQICSHICFRKWVQGIKYAPKGQDMPQHMYDYRYKRSFSVMFNYCLFCHVVSEVTFSVSTLCIVGRQNEYIELLHV